VTDLAAVSSVLDRLSVVAFPWGRGRPTVDELVEQAREAERLGFSTVNVPMVNAPLRDDHLFAALGNDHILDALVVMTALLRSTSTVRVCSDALPLPILPPYYWARALATLDVLSGGRLVAGVCPGYGREQFAAHGVPFANRGRRSEEAIEIVTRLWTEERVTFAGEYYRLDAATCEPKPVQKPRPPIWWAGGVLSIPRAARYAEYFVNFRPSFEAIRTELVPQLAAENERQGTSTKLACWVYCHVTPGRELSGDEIDAHFAGGYFADAPELPREVAVAGSPEQCAAKICEYWELGLSRLVLDFQNHGLEPVSSALEQMQVFAAEVVPLLD
jgi:alkanesulfonate monooxygenase SsuD/methylene tetrahydromethanopterin reductase-like flavin-dependent oxidoreductase (luciferase family)